MSEDAPEKTMSPLIKVHAVNTFQAGLLAIPMFGASLERLLFGTLAEARMNRLQQTLDEVCRMLSEKGKRPEIEGNEDFANLLEDVAPSLGRATSESKRRMFRDLLYNTIQLPKGDPDWEEAVIASQAIDKMSNLGLELVAALAKLTDSHENLCVIVFSDKDEAFFVARQNDELDFSLAKPYKEDYPKVSLSCSSDFLIRQTLMGLRDEDILDFGQERFIYKSVFMNVLGELIVRWALCNDFEENGENKA